MIEATNIFSKGLSRPVSKTINLTIKLLVFGLLAYIIYEQILVRENISELAATFKTSVKESNPLWLILCLILMPLNWLLEAKKWQLLTNSFEKQSLGQAIKTILGGLVFSLFTPARVGEYGGRILFVKPENNWKAAAATLVGSLSQMIIVMCIGGFGLIFLSQHIELLGDFSRLAAIFLCLGIICLGLFFFFNIDILINLLKRIKFLTKFKGLVKAIKVVKQYSRGVLLKAIQISFLRYMVYSLQYLSLIYFFGIEVPLVSAAASISGIFFIQTGIPLPPIWDLLARGEVAIQIWGIFEANKLSILAATFCLWVINLIIPSLLGMCFVVKINVLKSIGYGK